MNKLIIFIIPLIFFQACKEKSSYEKVPKLKEKIIKDTLKTAPKIDVQKTKTDVIKEKNISTDEIEGCHCFNGIGSSQGDKPALVFDFSNNKSVSICGYKKPNSKTNHLEISEFNIFDCVTGKKLVEYGALENCIIKTGNDKITIQLLTLLPAGKNWKWIPVKIADQIIRPDKNDFKVSELTVNYSSIKIDSALQVDFLNSLKKGNGFRENWEDDIGKLEVLSLNGNKKAWEILKNYEEYTGEKTDGALAEIWKDAKATVEWVTKKK